jgi:UDP-3-O-[3-hydroxymyristoyl] glucosamine N-acyltransferase
MPHRTGRAAHCSLHQFFSSIGATGGEMEHPGFFERCGPFPLRAVAEAIGVELEDPSAGSLPIEDVKALADAGPTHLSFLDNRKYIGQLAATRAGACLLGASFAKRAPASTVAMTTAAPYRAFARALQLFYADALRPKAANARGERGGALVHPSAWLEESVVIEPGAVIGPEAQVGRGTIVAAGALVGYRAVVGRDCYVGPGVTITHAIVGDRVILHAGVRIGQDGFGFAMGPQGHLKVPQIGRVLIHDDVEIGANSAVDRGSLKDTIIGAGTKIDNLVQIGHNVVIGRHCVIVAQSGIAGSAELGDFVVMGGHSGVVGHVKIGDGAQIAGMAHVKNDVSPGARMGGTPARPFRDWAREVAALKRLASRVAMSKDSEGS